jgi:hypothetical protein
MLQAPGHYICVRPAEWCRRPAVGAGLYEILIKTASVPSRKHTQCDANSRFARTRNDALPIAEAVAATPQPFLKELPMMDVIMLATGLVFFALSVGYAYACDRL